MIKEKKMKKEKAEERTAEAKKSVSEVPVGTGEAVEEAKTKNRDLEIVKT